MLLDGEKAQLLCTTHRFFKHFTTFETALYKLGASTGQLT